MTLVYKRFRSFCLVAMTILVCVSGCGVVDTIVYRPAINRVLQEYQRIANSQGSTRQKVAQLRRLSLVGCPRDFRLAFARHLQALENLAALEDEIGSAIGWGLLLGAAEIMLGVPGLLTVPAAGAYFSRYQELASQVQSTWEELIVVAASYGAG